MKRKLFVFAWLALVLEMLIYYWYQLPALNILSVDFWIFFLQSVGIGLAHTFHVQLQRCFSKGDQDFRSPETSRYLSD